MVIDKWVIQTPVRHDVDLEQEFSTGNLRLSIDGVGLLYRPAPSCSARFFEYQVQIDGRSYTLIGRRGFLWVRCDFLRTTDVSENLRRRLRTRYHLLRCGLLMALFAPSFLGAFNADRIVNHAEWDRRLGAPVTAFLIVLAALYFVGAAVHFYALLRIVMSSLPIAGDDTGQRPNRVTGGGPPRTGSYYRPLLADIAATAARLKRRFLRRPAPRDRVSNQ